MAIGAAGPVTYVPWQDCALPTDDFLVVRLMEIAVHADDLACSVGLPPPAFGPEVLEPVLAMLAALAARRRGQTVVLRALSRQRLSFDMQAGGRSLSPSIGCGCDSATDRRRLASYRHLFAA